MIRTETENSCLVIRLAGRIDSANAAETEKEIWAAIRAHPGLPFLLDAAKLSYLSSAGLRILLALTKETTERLVLRNVSPEVYDILSLTGFTSVLEARRRLREISVEGCPVIGRGAIGTVYLLDADTIVKVYGIPDCLPMIENEQKRAKQAFIQGIPTAISYDVVRVGDQYGSVFEMLNAENCNDLIVQSPDRLEELLDTYVDLLKTVHSVKMPEGELPDARQVYSGYVSDVAGVLPLRAAARLQALLADMPVDLHAVHGDIQMKNVMFSANGPLLIDMETLCTGDPVFDLAGLYMAYCSFNEDEPGNSLDFLGIDGEMCGRIYRGVLSRYLEGQDGETIRKAEDRISLLGCVRFLYLIGALNLGRPELKEIRIRHTRARIEALLERVDCLRLLA